jgi:predicted metal-binding membrane protein
MLNSAADQSPPVLEMFNEREPEILNTRDEFHEVSQYGRQATSTEKDTMPVQHGQKLAERRHPEHASAVHDYFPLRRYYERRTAATAAALTATLGLAVASWIIAVRQMNGMDMGISTQLGSFAFFVAVWVSMMAAMMLPGAAPAVLRHAFVSGRARTVPYFVASYLAIWTLVGVAVYALYRPHGTIAAAVVVIAAGVYELTPLKWRFRQRCRESVRSGFEFGLYCVGSSIGLMLMLVALSIMSITWMSVIAVLILVQKLLPAKLAVDVPLALAIVGLGILIFIAPSSVPGLMPPM